MGRTDCARFRVGHTFELENHHDAEHDGKYLITGMVMRAGYPLPVGELDSEPAGEAENYTARFTAIPFDVPFRPERLTPWPRINGVLHAHVAGDTAGKAAELDGQGRYKVRLPFDAESPKGSKASRWVRMAQPYAGAGYGQHFPLHKGTEVLLAHVDGDPDRPIIVGAVPNAHTNSPSRDANATQSVIQTASNIRIEMEDQA
jgi:type VI secretion system secreted protein VgrG